MPCGYARRGGFSTNAKGGEYVLLMLFYARCLGICMGYPMQESGVGADLSAQCE